MTAPFQGAKAALLFGDRLLATLRDDLPAIPFPGCWDLPGGGREGGEAPDETLAREVREEVGLDLAGAAWLWRRPFPSGPVPGETSWFFVLRMPDGAARGIALGDEGQGWALVPPARFVAMAPGVPFLQRRVALALAELGL
jgi:8-oxo-dGTP diphosphatase